MFNKIVSQGTPTMAVDKDKCSFPLFYVYPALTRYLSIRLLNILTLALAFTHSVDNLFHTFYCPRGK